MPAQGVEQFRAAVARKRKTAEVEIEGVGTVRIRALSAGDAQRFQAEVQKCQASGEDPEALAFVLVARSWIDADGEPWLPEEEGIALARALDPLTYNAVATAVLALNGLSADAVEVAEKSFPESPVVISPMGSPENSESPT